MGCAPEQRGLSAAPLRHGNPWKRPCRPVLHGLALRNRPHPLGLPAGHVRIVWQPAGCELS